MGQDFKFTTKRLEALEPPASGEAQLNDTDTQGLSIRLRASGGATFIVRYVVKGQRAARRFVIGPVSETNLDEARTVASGVIAAARAGRDPVAERKAQAKAAAKKAASGTTIAELIKIYEADQKANNIQSAAETAKRLRAELGDITKKPAAEISRAQFVGVLNKVRNGVSGHAAPRPGTATKLQANIHGLLSFGLNAGLLGVNIMAGYKAPRGSKKAQRIKKEQAQGVMLTMAEVAALWCACESRRVRPAFGAYIKALIITGARRDEMAHVKRSWVKAGSPSAPAHIIIPGAYTKNGAAHFLPLPQLAQGVLAGSPDVGSQLLFPGARSKITGKIAKISGWSKLWPMVLTEAKAFGLTRHVKIHDLRKNVRSHYARLGVADAIAKAQLNHTATDRLEGIYNQHDYRDLRIAAAEQWCAEIEASLEAAPTRAPLTAPKSNVIPIRKPSRARKARPAPAAANG